ncbi:MAG: peptidoglycan DD-metalloendopeptidase family protein [Deltaproteobacteria bacterium]|nr:peptidoglycan DD-metalloendopeptidase family protein [Deltaproteobacteria bacterium]
MKKKPLIIAALVLIFFWGAPVSFQGVALAESQKITEAQKKLEGIKQRLDKSYADLRSKQSREKSLRQDLAFVEEELEKYEKRLAGLEKDARAGMEDIGRKKDEIRLMEAAIEKTEDQVRGRLSALYKGDQATLIKLFFSSESPSQLIENFVYFERIVQRDKSILTTYRADHQHLKAGLETLKSLQAKQQVVLDATLDAKKEQEQIHQLKKKLLARTASEKKHLSRKITELEKRAKQLSALISKLEEEKLREYQGESGEFSNQKGKLAWPVNGKIKIGFGTWKHPELGTLYESQGIDIEAPLNNQIAAIWNGNVAFASRFKGYGNLMIINHGEGYYSLYGHASKLMKKVGEPVQRGEVVAFSGFEGKDSIYFEIRHRGIPLDPTKWLSPK